MRGQKLAVSRRCRTAAAAGSCAVLMFIVGRLTATGLQQDQPSVPVVMKDESQQPVVVAPNITDVVAESLAVTPKNVSLPRNATPWEIFMNTRWPWGSPWYIEDFTEKMVNSDKAADAALAKEFASLLDAPRQQATASGGRGKSGGGWSGGLPSILRWSRQRNAGEAPDKMIVAARAAEDVSYLSVYLSDIPHTVYQGGALPARSPGAGPQPMYIAPSQGREANVYLQYIVSHYDRLPRRVAFIHAHRNSWHMGDIVPVLRRLRWDNVAGYSNLRHANFSDWQCSGVGLPFPCGWEGGLLTPHEPFGGLVMAQPHPLVVAKVAAVTAKYWPAMFEHYLGPLPKLLYTQCCAEFVVTRERILAHPKAFYQHMLDVLGSYDEALRHELGLAFEYTWHVIFGEPSVNRPTPECELLTC